VFCGPACRQQYHSATRRWAEAAVAAGTLSLDQIRNGAAAACTLLPGAISPAPLSEHRKAAAVAQDQAVELLDKLLTALLALPPNELSWLIYYRLPGELGERLRDRMKPENRPLFPSRPR
jgi:hypothetical protein